MVMIAASATIMTAQRIPCTCLKDHVRFNPKQPLLQLSVLTFLRNHYNKSDNDSEPPRKFTSAY